jgi:hypothetical protein
VQYYLSKFILKLYRISIHLFKIIAEYNSLIGKVLCPFTPNINLHVVLFRGSLDPLPIRLHGVVLKYLSTEARLHLLCVFSSFLRTTTELCTR